jgi:hypothetical protein
MPSVQQRLRDLNLPKGWDLVPVEAELTEVTELVSPSGEIDITGMYPKKSEAWKPKLHSRTIFGWLDPQRAPIPSQHAIMGYYKPGAVLTPEVLARCT